MWKLPVWYGTVLICMMVATLVALFAEPYVYKSTAFVYGSIFNVNVIVLLFAICLPSSASINKDEDEEESQEDESQRSSSSPSHDNPSSSSNYPQQQPPSSNFIAFDDADDDTTTNKNDQSFTCCLCGWKVSYSFFFVSSILLSILISCATLPVEYAQDIIYVWGPHASLFLVTHGALLLTSFFSWIERGYCTKCMPCLICNLNSSDTSQIQDSNVGDTDAACNNDGIDRSDNLLLKPQRHQMMLSSKTLVLMSFILGIISLLLATLLYRNASKNLDTINSFTTHTDVYNSNGGIYNGEAYVTGFTLLADDDKYDDDCTRIFCSSWDASIPVNVSVAWGGNWGCPLTGSYCEDVVTSQVSCRFIDVGYDDDAELFISKGIYDYLSFRYHEDDGQQEKSDDGNADAFGDYYDEDNSPQYSTWNRPSESIYGNCNTCQARSKVWMIEEAHMLASRINIGSILIGTGLVFIGWPMMTWFFVRRNDSATSISESEGVLA